METPDRLFHITRTENALKIFREGFATGMTFFSSDIDNATRFIVLRLNDDNMDDWMAVEIDATQFDVHLSYDHSPDFFGTEDSWYITGEIGPDAIVNMYEITYSPKESVNG